MGEKIRVLIIDDSAFIQKILTQVLSEDPDIEVVGVAPDPYVAQEKVRALKPDVLTLDVEMPRMDGLTFLEELMRTTPMPVVMVSSLTQEGCETTLRSLELGAVDFITKPRMDLSPTTRDIWADLVEKIKAAARAHVRPRQEAAGPRALHPSGAKAKTKATQLVIAVGASTGGTEAIRDFLTEMPADCPGIVIVQHMPEKFTRAFADRLNNTCAIEVKEARDGDRILSGHAFIAPGNHHLELRRLGPQFLARLHDGPPVNRHRPSADVLFRSVAAHAGGNAIGVIMTGMGDDGARGLLAIKEAGGRTIAQDEATSVVFGMPKEAIALGAADRVVPLDRMAEEIMKLLG